MKENILCVDVRTGNIGSGPGSEPFEGPEQCSCCGNPDHGTELCPLIDMTCELCGMQGHMENMCDTQEVPSTET